MREDDYMNPSQLNIDLFNQKSGPLVESPIMRLNTWRTVTTSDNQTLIVQTHNYATKNDKINVLFILTHDTTSEGQLSIEASGNTVRFKSPCLQTGTDKEAMAIAIDEWLTMSRRANSTIKYSGSANATGADIVRDIASSAGTHMIGTTILGTDDDSKGGKSVVDTDCKVYGTDYLFVVDAGIHADVPTGNTQAIVGVVAEHAVQKIIALDAPSGGGNSTSPDPPLESATKEVVSSTVAAIPSSNAAANGTYSIPPVLTATAVLTTIIPATSVAVTSVAPAPTGAGTVAPYGRCGGNGYTGPTACTEGWTCKVQNDWYSQCVSA